MKVFRWLNKQGVESDSGFVLQRMHRFYYHYLESGKIMQVVVEPGKNLEDVFIGKGNRWEPPHQDVELDSSDVERIADNVAAALKFMGTRFQITSQ